MSRKGWTALILALMMLHPAFAEDVPELLEPVGVKADTATVIRGDLYNANLADGTIKAQTTELAFKISGRIEVLNVHVGQYVEEGTILAEIDQTSEIEWADDLRETIADIIQSGELEDSISEVDVEMETVRLQQLKANGADDMTIKLKEMDIAQRKMDIVHAQESREIRLKRYREQLADLEEEIGRNKVIAPFSGHVYFDPYMRAGSYVKEDHTVFYMVDPTDLIAEISTYMTAKSFENRVYYVMVRDMRLGAEYLEMTRAEMSSIVLSGKKLTTRLKLVGDPESLSRVQPGDYAALYMEGLHKEDVLQIPYGALYMASGECYVYVITENGKEKRVIHYGSNNGIMLEVTDGLKEGEVVYVKN